MLMELTDYIWKCIKVRTEVYFHNRFIRSEPLRFSSPSIRTSKNKENKNTSPGLTLWFNKQNKQTNENIGGEKSTKNSKKKKGTKPKILLNFIFFVSHQVAMELGFFFLVGLGVFVWVFFYFVLSSPPSKHQVRFCNEIF